MHFDTLSLDYPFPFQDQKVFFVELCDQKNHSLSVKYKNLIKYIKKYFLIFN